MAIIGRERIEKWVYTILRPYLSNIVKGGVYRSECRPQDSGREDAEIVVSTVSSGQVQRGVVKVNIYVQDIKTGSRFFPDKARMTELEEVGDEMLALLKLNSNSSWSFSQAPDNFIVRDTREHLLNFSFDFKRPNIK